MKERLDRTEAALLQKQAGDDAQAASLASGFSLTPLQAGMLYETIATGNPGVNLEQVVIHLEDEPLDEPRMRAAWQSAISRHPALRLVFHLPDADAASQRVLPDADLPLTVQDWTDNPDPDAALRALLLEDRQQGVDLTRGPCWRLRWLRLGPQKSVLIWTFPHIILDGRSFTRVLHEVFADYDGQETGSGSAPPFQAHCEALAKHDATADKAYFQQMLQGFDQANRIGFGPHAAPTAPVVGKPILSARVAKPQVAALEKLAVRTGVTLATIVQGAWGLVVARCSGRTDAVFGVTRTGRYLLPDARDMVGCLIITVPQRATIERGLTLGGYLGKLRADQIAQRPHEYANLTDIQAVTDIGRGHPMFETLVMFERGTLEQNLRDLGGVWAGRRVDLHEEGAMPLTLAAYAQQEMVLRLEYDPARLTADNAGRYLKYLQQLLCAMAEAKDDVLLGQLSMLDSAETGDLLKIAEPEHVVEAAGLPCIATSFEEQTNRHPDALAVAQVGAGQGVSYGALDRRANQLAHHLRAQGIGPGQVVGLCLPRSIDFIAALLAVLKSGAAFVPMDPSYPPEALAHMASDSDANLIIAAGPAEWMEGHETLLLSADIAGDAPETAPDRTGYAADRLAYVLYTSGTTGRPKGVMVSHRALAAHAIAAREAYGLTSADRALQFNALSFDIALEEIVPTLLSGAALILRSNAMASAPMAFLEAISVEGITVLNLPTGFWQVLLGALEEPAVSLPKSLRLLIVGGERTPPAALSRWRKLQPNLRWINGYGPTETTITSAFHEPQKPVAGAEVPVGRAMGHALLYVLTPDRSLAPKGATAELWIGGPAVAEGYRGRPEATAESFLPNPYGSGRLYRSGDLAYWNADGDLVIEGRSDRQIKLRGFRIEPAEVEAVLEAMPEIRQALVSVIGAGTPSARLIGWVRPAGKADALDVQALRKAAAKKLPASKLPELVIVSDWPQTPGGKVDMSRLPLPAIPDTASDPAAPMDANTKRVAALFQSVLGGPLPGAESSFFDLGGHSLLLLGLIGRVEAEFDQRLSVAQIHADPTPAGLARLLADPAQTNPINTLSDCIMPIQPNGDRAPIYGVHVLGINGSFFRPLAKEMGPDQPIFGLTVGLLNDDTPMAVQDIAALYFRAIEYNQPEGPVGLAAVSLGSYIALELAQQLMAAGREVRMLVLFDAEGPDGRQKIKGISWLQAHLSLMSEGGIGYLGDVFWGKWANLRHRIEKLKLATGDLGRVSSSTIKTVDSFVAANEVAIKQYQPAPYQNRLTIIRAMDSVFDSDQAVADGLGWASVAHGGMDVIDIPGDHLSILQEPGVRTLARVLASVIDPPDS